MAEENDTANVQVRSMIASTPGLGNSDVSTI